MNANLAKSMLHNTGVLIVSILFGLLGTGVDALFNLQRFTSPIAAILGITLILTGYLIRTWAAYIFYQHDMKVIVLAAQSSLITTGPFRYSRNPLYLGGNFFMFLGMAIFFGSIGGIILTGIELSITDQMIRREEKQLEHAFGEQWIQYRSRTPRWV